MVLHQLLKRPKILRIMDPPTNLMIISIHNNNINILHLRCIKINWYNNSYMEIKVLLILIVEISVIVAINLLPRNGSSVRRVKEKL